MTKKRAGRPTDRSKDSSIMKAARELLYKKGPEAVTMEGVATKAKVSKGTMYSRYTNRQQLLQSIVERESRSITLSIDVAPKTPDELKIALLDFAEQLTSFLVSKEHLKLMEVMALPTGVQAGLKKEIYQNGPQQTLDSLSIFLESSAKSGLVNCDNPSDSAELLLGMMMGLDLVRAWYGVPLRIKQKKENQAHAQTVITAFLALH